MELISKLSPKARADYELVLKARDEGDERAFAKLMTRYKDSIFFMMLKMVNNQEDADDLTIEAFGKAFNRLDQYAPNYAFSTWLFKIATNNCIDFIRKKRMKTLSLDSSMDPNEENSPTADVKDMVMDPEQNFMKKQKVRLLREVVEKLKPRYRELVVFRYFKEMSYQEIAVEMNLPIGTVKAQLYRAREDLYELIGPKKDRFF